MSVELQKTGMPLRKHGPAYSLRLKWLEGDFYKDLYIDIDLTLAVRINSQSMKLKSEFSCLSSPAGEVLRPLLDSLPYFAVGSYRNVLKEVEPNFFEENAIQFDSRSQNLCLRSSQSCVERSLFCKFGSDGGQTKCLRLLKLLRDLLFVPSDDDFLNQSNKIPSPAFTLSVMRDGFRRVLSSYALKTLVLYEWLENPADDSWSERNLRQRLLSTLCKLCGHLKEGKLVSFFYTDYNIFSSKFAESSFLPKVTSIITEVRKRLESIDNMETYHFEECFEMVFEHSDLIREYDGYSLYPEYVKLKDRPV